VEDSSRAIVRRDTYHNSTDLVKQIEADLMTAAKDMIPEEPIDGFNKNMARNGQISHNADELGRTLGKGRRWWGAMRLGMSRFTIRI